MKVTAVCKPTKADDGVFWLSKAGVVLKFERSGEEEEFFKYFKTVYLCAQDMSAFVR